VITVFCVEDFRNSSSVSRICGVMFMWRTCH